MALNATIFKATLQISDLDRQYYQDHTITLARHPSETDERMMVRLLAFALHAHEALSFGRGVSAVEEPALWARDLTGTIDTWIEVGQPDEKSIRQACGRAKQVYVYTYGGRGADQWWEKNLATLERLNNLTVMNLPLEGSRAIAQLAQPNMQLHCTIQERQVWMADGANNIHMKVLVIKNASQPFGR
ncbi:MAG: YaeQ family protein [Nitrospiraceae bacterium]|nr:MAG: YaeQ family protein [Nitrospiraceae bacterium]